MAAQGRFGKYTDISPPVVIDLWDREVVYCFLCVRNILFVP